MKIQTFLKTFIMALMVLSLVACGSDDDDDNNADQFRSMNRKSDGNVFHCLTGMLMSI